MNPAQNFTCEGCGAPFGVNPKRLVAYCCTCQQRITNLPLHVQRFKEHRDSVRYVLMPDLRCAP
jgi:hypothetical protein